MSRMNAKQIIEQMGLESTEQTEQARDSYEVMHLDALAILVEALERDDDRALFNKLSGTIFEKIWDGGRVAGAIEMEEKLRAAGQEVFDFMSEDQIQSFDRAMDKAESVSGVSDPASHPSEPSDMRHPGDCDCPACTDGTVVH